MPRDVRVWLILSVSQVDYEWMCIAASLKVPMLLLLDVLVTGAFAGSCDLGGGDRVPDARRVYDRTVVAKDCGQERPWAL